MSRISTESIPIGSLTAIPELVSADKIAALDVSTGKTHYITASQILLSKTGDNTFSGANDFTGKFSLDSVEVTATATELNKNDVSVQSEEIDSGDAVSVTKFYTSIDNTDSGAGAITLAVPNAAMIGQIKTIEMTTDGGDVTLALTNVVGGAEAATATFAAAGDTLVLIARSDKWIVLKEQGVTLSA